MPESQRRLALGARLALAASHRQRTVSEHMAEGL